MEKKKPIPALLPGQDKSYSCGATLLGASAPTSAYVSYADFVYEVSLRLPYSRQDTTFFRSPSEVHSALYLPPQFHHLRLSVGTGTRPTYSPSSVWWYYITHTPLCQGGYGHFSGNYRRRFFDFHSKAVHTRETDKERSMCAPCRNL